MTAKKQNKNSERRKKRSKDVITVEQIGQLQHPRYDKTGLKLHRREAKHTDIGQNLKTRDDSSILIPTPWIQRTAYSQSR